MKLTVLIPLASLAVVASVVVLGAMHDGPSASDRIEAPVGDLIPDVDLGLGEGLLLGRIVDESGGGIADAGVTTEQNGRPMWTWTDVEGSFRFKDLIPGDLKLRVVAQGFEAMRFDARAPEGSGDPALQSFVMDRPIGPVPVPPALELRDLEGSVTLGPLAETDRDYEVLLLPTTSPTNGNGGFPRRAAVGPGGGFSVDLLHAGEYQVILLGPDSKGGREPDLLASADGSIRTFTHETKGDTPRLELMATMGAVTGRAVEEVGTPLRGALVRIEPLGRANEEGAELFGSESPGPAESSERGGAGPPEPEDLIPQRSLFQATRTDKEGRFSLRNLQPGQYVLQLFAGRTRLTRRIAVADREIKVVDFDSSAPSAE